MIKLEHVILPSPEQMAFVVEGMRNPMNSWDRSDSGLKCSQNNNDICDPHCTADNYCSPLHEYLIGSNDLDLMRRLSNAGAVHRKYMRMIPVYVRITAPLYWWKEFDTYKVGTVANSCSTMHKIQAKEFTLEDFSCEHLFECPLDILKDEIIPTLNHYRDSYLNHSNNENKKDIWWQMIQLLPSSYNQTRNVMLNYEVLAAIYEWRKDHKLDEWREFCKWIERLPHSELITQK